jgi:hypothetical protein
MSLFNHATPLNCKVHASSKYGDAYSPDRVIDGSDFTSWCSTPGGGDDLSVNEWMEVNLRNPISIEIVRITWGEGLQVHTEITVCARRMH